MESIGWSRANRRENDKGREVKKKEPKYGTFRLKGKYGESRAFDLNKDTEVARMYNLMEKTYGWSKEKRPKTIDEMRELIIGYTGNSMKVKDTSYRDDKQLEDHYRTEEYKEDKKLPLY